MPRTLFEFPKSAGTAIAGTYECGKCSQFEPRNSGSKIALISDGLNHRLVLKKVRKIKKHLDDERRAISPIGHNLIIMGQDQGIVPFTKNNG